MAVLDEKVAIVTGSARGIGRATAELLAEHGAKVLVNDLDGDVAEEASNEIPGETVAFAGDLTQDGVPAIRLAHRSGIPSATTSSARSTGGRSSASAVY